MSVVSPSFRARARSAAEAPARLFGRLGLTPNALTVIGFLIAVVGAVLAATENWLPAALVVAFGALFDMFDGALARATNSTTKLGAFMDSVFDRAGEAVVYIGISIAFLNHGATFHALLAVTAMAAAFMVSYVRAKSESLGFTSGTGMANIGLAPREVRTAILVVGLFAAALLGGFTTIFCVVGPCPPLMNTGAQVLAVALGTITLLATITTIQRIYHVYKQAQKEP